MANSKKRHKQSQFVKRYSPADELIASPTKPLSKSKSIIILTKVFNSLERIQQSIAVDDDWQEIANITNILYTLVNDMEVFEDTENIIQQTNTLLFNCYKDNKFRRVPLTKDELSLLTSVIDQFEEILNTVPERVVIRAYRLTEKHAIEMLQGNKRQGDIVI